MVVRGSVIAHEAILQPWSFLIHADNFYSAVQRCVTTGIFGIFNFRTTWTPSATRFFHLLTSKLNEIASELIISIVYLRACNRWAVHSRTGRSVSSSGRSIRSLLSGRLNGSEENLRIEMTLTAYLKYWPEKFQTHEIIQKNLGNPVFRVINIFRAHAIS